MISIDELRIKLPNFEKMVKLGEFVNKLEKGEI